MVNITISGGHHAEGGGGGKLSGGEQFRPEKH